MLHRLFRHRRKPVAAAQVLEPPDHLPKLVTPLPLLPLEILELIAARLTDPVDFCSLRLTCKEVQHKTRQVFGRTHLQTIHTDLTRSNLRSLSSLANEEFLRKYPTELHVHTEWRRLGKGFYWERETPRGHLKQPILDNEGGQALRDILANGLVNCKAFRISTEGYCDESASEIGQIMATDAVTIVLSVILDAKIPMRSFCIEFMKPKGGFPLDGRRLTMQDIETPIFQEAWAGLEELGLEHSLDTANFWLTMKLLYSAINLKSLSLNLAYGSCKEFMRCALSTHALHSLRKIKLHSMILWLDDFLGIISRSMHSLLDLSLYHVALIGEEPWQSVFKALKSDCSLLKSIKVAFLREATPSRDVHFPELSLDNLKVPSIGMLQLELEKKRHGRESRIIGASYEGSRMSDVFELLANTMTTE